MKVVIQRALASSVEVDNKLINKIEKGMVILVGVNVEDTSEDVDYLVRKTLNLRIFDDENGVMNKSILDVGGEILSISQFTLQASTKDGNRPSYINAMKGEEAVKLYEEYNKKLNEKVKTYPGVFGAEMKVSITNDGPITIIIDSKNK
ncbi:MAG: D-tyrosyl-tRNA(Tyr) deacylase [Bacilli bacterium]|nr:D-tyrosyl-tRNA(Tyr) deacylase [bacterium]MBP3456929.1 D-tyrosyl-tRNA(Tyr) deacylase [Bacilli bacterium]PWL40992.1 MAG: D-tyrosyl-tRNA(Tyr) deacylase [Clostridiaceae bacterium]CDA52182.1 d-tyrosyl-tRNA(Tyr) deacylase [Clostridium sp. CAG:533]